MKKLFHARCTTKMSIEKSTKKEDYNSPHFLRLMLFDKIFCRFSSLLDIYKSTFLRYNITRRWAIARRVPSFAHRGSIPAKCQSYDIPLSRTEQRCAFLIFQDPFFSHRRIFSFCHPPLTPQKRAKNEAFPPLTPSKKVIFTTLHHPIDNKNRVCYNHYTNDRFIFDLYIFFNAYSGGKT